MTPPKSLTDSQKEMAAIAGEAGAEAAARSTPLPRENVSQMFEVAEAVARRSQPAHMLECEEKGPACKLGKRMEKMEAKIEDHGKIISEFVGAQKLSRWLVPMVASLATSGLVVAMLKLMWGGLK